MPPSTEQALQTYLGEIRRIRSTHQHTPEQSFYGPLGELINAMVAGQRPSRRAMNHPNGISGDFPDLAVYEVDANVLVLPWEVKAPSDDVTELAASDQATRYARTFGGGCVMVTNLRQFVLARMGASGKLVTEGEVTLVPQESDLDAPAPELGETARDLAILLDEACQVRGNLVNPATVAEFLAFHARDMRDSIKAGGDPAVLLSPIHRALKEGLGIDVPPELLVATVVQTLVYGLFAAWLDDEDPTDFDWMDSSYRLEVPVFADVLHNALRPALIRRCNLKRHLDAVARVLMWVNRDAFTEKFDGGAIEYFYEPFLAKFDDQLRDKLGVWYTPRAIAEYQVARADHHVRHDLGIEAGLADPSVMILDPACGTGTYLGAVYRFIRDVNLANHEPEHVAASRAAEAAVTRVFGFEILPAAFIVSHLHLGRLLAHMGTPVAPDTRLRVYLTNALTGWGPEGAPVGTTLFPELEEELHDSARVKHSEPVLVILGNPPYQGYSSAATEDPRRLHFQVLGAFRGLRREFSGSALPCPLAGLASRGCRIRLMLRAGRLLPPKGLSTLGSDAGRFPPTPPACYRASWQLPGPDSHRLADTTCDVGHLNFTTSFRKLAGCPRQLGTRTPG